MGNKEGSAKAENGSGPLGVAEALRQEHDYFRGVRLDKTAAARSGATGNNKTPDQQAEERDRELAALYDSIHKLPNPRTALCFSGGGIRSATFALGLIQGMARKGLLEGFDYLSTVSGGGYIGSWLSAWINRHKDGLSGVVKELNSVTVPLPTNAATTEEPKAPVPKIDPEPQPLEHLRAYSNYLSPRAGLFTTDAWSIIATYLRNLLLNWLVLIPFLAAVLVLPLMALAAVNLRLDPPYMNFLTGLALVTSGCAGVIMMAYTDRQRPSLQTPKPDGAAQGPAVADKSEPSGIKNDEANFLRYALLPLLIAAMALTAFGAWAPHSKWFNGLGHELRGYWFGLWVPFGLFGASLTLAGWGLNWKLERKSNRPFEALVLALVGFIGGAALWKIYDATFPFGLPGGTVAALASSHATRHVLYACLAGPLLLFLLFIFSNVLVGAVSGFTDDVDREWWARAAAWTLLTAVGWSVGSVLVLFGPYGLLLALSRAPALVTSLGGVTGIIAVVLGKSGRTAGRGPGAKAGKTSVAAEIATALAAPLFIALLIVLIALGSTVLLKPELPSQLSASYRAYRAEVQAQSWKKSREPEPRWYPGEYLVAVDQVPLHWVFLFLSGALAPSILMSCFVNVNKFSMHAMYRNRLVRAYLGASHPRSHDLFADFEEEDNVFMAELAEPSPGKFQRPFHVVNMTLNLTVNSRLAWQQRMAESFTASPLHGGSLQLGYRAVEDYSSISPTRSWLGVELTDRPPKTGLTLGTAMAISGAAVSPNMGYHSSPLVAFLLTFFNVRLGWWLGNPGPEGNGTYRFSSPRSALRSLLDELMGRSSDKDVYVTLSDGGQFENLGLYEMVLRRCRLIIVSDAGEDPGYSFEDLSNALTKIHTDLGVPIDFADQVPISKFSSKLAKDSEEGKKDLFDGKYCAVGIIRYSAVDTVEKRIDGTGNKIHVPAPDGLLICFKPTLTGQEPADLLHYARSNPAFPQEPTLDEFYSESQFESYRVLGDHVIEYLCNDATADPVSNPSSGFGRLRAFAGRALRHAHPAPAGGAPRETQARLQKAFDDLPPGVTGTPDSSVGPKGDEPLNG